MIRRMTILCSTMFQKRKEKKQNEKETSFDTCSCISAERVRMCS